MWSPAEDSDEDIGEEDLIQEYGLPMDPMDISSDDPAQMSISQQQAFEVRDVSNAIMPLEPIDAVDSRVRIQASAVDGHLQRSYLPDISSSQQQASQARQLLERFNGLCSSLLARHQLLPERQEVCLV